LRAPGLRERLIVMHLPRRAIHHVGRTRPFTRRCHTAPTFDRFTERTRDALALAQDEAKALGHDYIGTEHLLLGILREGEGVAARILRERGMTAAQVRHDVLRIVGKGPSA
jgi:Clp amino terminal domain, pathogenicity island component